MCSCDCFGARLLRNFASTLVYCAKSVDCALALVHPHSILHLLSELWQCVHCVQCVHLLTLEARASTEGATAHEYFGRIIHVRLRVYGKKKKTLNPRILFFFILFFRGCAPFGGDDAPRQWSSAGAGAKMAAAGRLRGGLRRAAGRSVRLRRGRHLRRLSLGSAEVFWSHFEAASIAV